MKKIRIISLLLMALLIKPFCGFCQITDCSVNYEKALLLYNSGMADSCLSVMKPCLDNTDALNKIQRELRSRIFRLSALAYIMTGNPAEAEKYARKLLVNQPDYKSNPDENDLEEFRLMLEKITPQPSFRVGVAAGINFPMLELQKNYSSYEYRNGETTLKGSVGYGVGIIAEKAFTGNLSLEAGIGFCQVIFDYTVSGTDITTSLPFDNLYDQSLSYIEVPVIARYYFNLGSFKPFLEGGINGRILVNSMEKSDDFGRYWFTNSYGSDNILTTFLTDLEYFGFILGGGASYDFNKFTMRLDFRYNHYLKNSGASSEFDDITGYDDIGPDENFYYTDDINLINHKLIQVSIGFLYNLSYKVF